jgi:hypothetical protein
MPKRVVGNRPVAVAQVGKSPTRLSLELVDAESKGRRAALKAWKTRRENARQRAAAKP